MHARDYNRSDKWSAHYRSNRIRQRSGETPLHISDPDMTTSSSSANELHSKFLDKMEHNQTQYEIPIVDMITDYNYEQQNRAASKLISDAVNMLEDYEADYDQNQPLHD